MENGIYIEKRLHARLHEASGGLQIVISIWWDRGFQYVGLRSCAQSPCEGNARGITFSTVLSNDLNRRQIKALCVDLQPLIAEVREGWYMTINPRQEVRGFYGAETLDALDAIRDRIAEANGEDY